MIEISPEELLPENFADFKKQIPDLKIAVVDSNRKSSTKRNVI